MDLQKIRTLLEKFYSGETTLSEEKYLREYFSTENVDNEFTVDKDIFLYQLNESESYNDIPDISNEIVASIDKIDDYKLKSSKRLSYYYLRIAASIIIILGSFLLIKNQVINKNKKG